MSSGKMRCVSVDLNPMTDSLIKRENIDTYRGKRLCEDGAEVGIMHLGTATTVGNHQKPGKGKEGFFLPAFRGSMAVPTP